MFLKTSPHSHLQPYLVTIAKDYADFDRRGCADECDECTVFNETIGSHEGDQIMLRLGH